jgi:hypothetical protein
MVHSSGMEVVVACFTRLLLTPSLLHHSQSRL